MSHAPTSEQDLMQVTNRPAHTSTQNNPLADYFGPLPAHAQMRAADGYPLESYVLGDAYEGRNLYLATILDFLIRSSDRYEFKLLPYKETDELHISWNVFKFNRTLAGYEPELGVPRLVTQESSSRSDSLARRGLAFQLEHGFYSSPQGREAYLMNMRQIENAVEETNAYDVMNSILTAKNYWNEWQQLYGSAGCKMRDLMKRDKFEWALLNRNPKGAYLIDGVVKDRMRAQGITPNTIVLPPRAAIYLNLGTEWATEYSRRGPAMENALDTAPKNISTFRGSTCYEANSFDYLYQGQPNCPLTRNRQCGEYYILESNEKSIRIFDMDLDDWKLLKRKPKPENDTSTSSTASATGTTGTDDAFPTADVQTATGKADVSALETLFTNLKTGNPAEFQAAKDQLTDADRFNKDSPPNAIRDLISDPGEQSKFGKVISTTNQGVLLEDKVWKWVFSSSSSSSSSGGGGGGGGTLPATGRLLIMRPFACYRMGSMLYAKAGSDLGNTFTAHGDFMMSTNAVSKMHIGHYTYYSKAVVRNEKCFYIANDVYAEGYVGGDSTNIYDPDDLASDLREDKCGTSEQKADLIVMEITEDDVTNPIDIRGTIPDCCCDSGKPCFKPVADGDGTLYDKINKNIDGDDKRTDRLEYQKQYHTANTICFKGACRAYEDRDGNTEVRKQLSTGMWGPHGTYPGCASARSGGMTELCCRDTSQC